MDADLERRFSRLVAEHRDRAVGLAWRLLGGDSGAAEDVAQEAFLRAYRGLGKFREEAVLSTWFYRILINEAQRYRRLRWLRRRVADEGAEEVAGARQQGPGDPGLRRRVARAIDRLPRGQREAFILVYLEGFTIQETAVTTGKALGTIKSHLHRALKSLRAELDDLRPAQKPDRS